MSFTPEDQAWLEDVGLWGEVTEEEWQAALQRARASLDRRVYTPGSDNEGWTDMGHTSMENILLVNGEPWGTVTDEQWERIKGSK